MDVNLTDHAPGYFSGPLRQQLKKVEKMLNALSKLQVTVLLPTGQQLTGTIQIGDGSSTVFLRANSGGAPTAQTSQGTATVQPTQDLLLCDGSTITVLLAALNN